MNVFESPITTKTGKGNGSFVFRFLVFVVIEITLRLFFTPLFRYNRFVAFNLLLATIVDFFRFNDDKSRGHSLHPWLHLPPPRLVSPVSAPR